MVEGLLLPDRRTGPGDFGVTDDLADRAVMECRSGLGDVGARLLDTGVVELLLLVVAEEKPAWYRPRSLIDPVRTKDFLSGVVRLSRNDPALVNGLGRSVAEVTCLFSPPAVPNVEDND